MIPSLPVEWTPMANYAGAHHVLGAGACFVHPGNGNIYFWDCVQVDGPRQNLTIYRLVAKTGAWEKVVTFEGAKDAERGFERGQVQIGQGGALWVGTTMIPKDVPHVTEEGFQGVRCRIPNVDEPWGDTGLAARFAAIEQRLTRIESAPADTTGGALTPEQAANLEWLAALRKLLSAT